MISLYICSDLRGSGVAMPETRSFIMEAIHRELASRFPPPPPPTRVLTSAFIAKLLDHETLNTPPYRSVH